MPKIFNRNKKLNFNNFEALSQEKLIMIYGGLVGGDDGDIDKPKVKIPEQEQ